MAHQRLLTQGRLLVPREVPHQQQGTCFWSCTRVPPQVKREARRMTHPACPSCCDTQPWIRCQTATPTSRTQATEATLAAAAFRNPKALRTAVTNVVVERRISVSPLVNSADGRPRAREAGTVRCRSALRSTSTEKARDRTSTGEESEDKTTSTVRPRALQSAGKRLASVGEYAAQVLDRAKKHRAKNCVLAATERPHKMVTGKLLFVVQPQRWISASCSSAGTVAAVAAESVAGTRDKSKQQGVPVSSSGIESNLAAALSAQVEEQEAAAEERFTASLNNNERFLLDTGEIVPAAFAAVKHVRDFRLLPVYRLLHELRTRRQELLLQWQKMAETKIYDAVDTPAVNGYRGEAVAEAHEREQRLLQQRIVLLQQLLLPLSPAVHHQMPFLPADQAVCCLLHLTAGLEAAVAANEVPGAERLQAEAAALAAAAETNSSDIPQLQQQWHCCCTRLKEVVLTAEESLLVLHCISAVGTPDAGGLLAALVERIEAAYFSTEAQSSPLVHPVFCVWEPRCSTIAAAVNCLPLSYKARLIHQDTWRYPRLDDNGGWQQQRKEEEPQLPTWQTMQPVDMEAWEKKCRRVVRTRFVQAKVLRQTDGRKLAAALALHARQAICADARLDSLVACAAIAAAASVRPFRGNFLTESLDLLAAELLRRPLAEIAAAALPLTTLLAGAAPFPLKQQLFAHLASATRTLISYRGKEEQQETSSMKESGTATRESGTKDELLLLQQLRHVPVKLQLLFETPRRGEGRYATAKANTLSESHLMFQYHLSRLQEQQQDPQRQHAGAAKTRRRMVAVLFARLLCNFFFVEDYRAPHSLLVLLSRNLLRVLQWTTSDTSTSGTTRSHDSTKRESRSALDGGEDANQSTKEYLLPLAAVAALFDGAATAGFAYAPLLHGLLRQLQRLSLRRLERDNSSAVEGTACAATESSETLELWEGSPSDLAMVLQSLVILNPGDVFLLQQQGAHQPQRQQENIEEFHRLKNKFVIAAWEVLRPLLPRLRRDTRLLIFNSLCSLRSSPYTLPLHNFEETVQEFSKEFPELLNVNRLGALFTNG